MNIVREGPRHLVIESHQTAVTYEKMKSIFSYTVAVEKSDSMYEDYINMIGLLDGTCTIVLFARHMKETMTFQAGDFDYIAVVNKTSEDVLINLIKAKDQLAIDDIRTTPGLIIMRTTGESDLFIASVNKELQGDLVSTQDMFENYGEGSLIVFTDKKIGEPLGIHDFYHQAIYVDKKAAVLEKYLNNNRVKFVNASIRNKDWSELVIKIFDSYEQYDIHYKRLAMIINAMDCGLILGESWGKDTALAFLSVGVYQVRLFTYMEPRDVKKIALGLEYDNKGNRLVDYDLYIKRKKLSWSDVRDDKKMNRHELGLYYRKKLMYDLNELTSFELLALEKQIKN